jgi:hypothetical protein
LVLRRRLVAVEEVVVEEVRLRLQVVGQIERNLRTKQ